MPEFTLPFVTIGNFSFILTAIAGIDWSNYRRPLASTELESSASEDSDSVYGEIELLLIGGGSYIFEGEEADAFKLWFDQVTGKSRIEQASNLLSGPFKS